MKEHANTPDNQFRTLDSTPKASRQPPMDVILQHYKERNKRYAEDELLQGKFESASASGQEPRQGEEQPNTTGLPDNLKTGVENLSGYSLDDVQVHYNSSKPTQLQALAYAQGTDIHVAPGQEKHLPHEAWHVVQQKQGRVHPTLQLQGMDMNDNEGLEREADEIGKKIMDSPSTMSIPGKSIANSTKVIQGFWPLDGLISWIKSFFISQAQEEEEEEEEDITESSESKEEIEKEDTKVPDKIEKAESITKDGGSIPTASITSSQAPQIKARPIPNTQKKQIEKYLQQIGTRKLKEEDKQLVQKIKKYIDGKKFDQSEFDDIVSTFERREIPISPENKTATPKEEEYTDYQFQNIINMKAALEAGKGYEDQLILSIKRWVHDHVVGLYIALKFNSGDKKSGKYRIILSKADKSSYRIVGVVDYHDRTKWLFQVGEEADDSEEIDESTIRVNNCLIDAIAGAAGRPATEDEIIRIRHRLLNERGYRLGSMLYAAPAVVNIIRQELGINNTITVHYLSQPDEVVAGTGQVLHIYHNGTLHFQQEDPMPHKRKK